MSTIKPRPPVVQSAAELVREAKVEVAKNPHGGVVASVQVQSRDKQRAVVVSVSAQNAAEATDLARKAAEFGLRNDRGATIADILPGGGEPEGKPLELVTSVGDATGGAGDLKRTATTQASLSRRSESGDQVVRADPIKTSGQHALRDGARDALQSVGDITTASTPVELQHNSQVLADGNPGLARAVKAYGQNLSSVKDYQAAQAQIEKAVDRSPYWKSQTPKQRDEGIRNYTTALLGAGPAAAAQALADANPAVKRAIVDYGRTLKQGGPNPDKYKSAAGHIAQAVARSPFFQNQGAAAVAEATKNYTALLLGARPTKSAQTVF